MLRPCIEPDCQALVQKPLSRCARHERAKGRAQKARTGRRGSTTRWRNVREQILARDDYRCQECGAQQRRGARLEVDHVDGDRNNDAPENLRSLCENCHRAKTLKQAERNAILVLVGEPGVGKTAICEALAKSFGEHSRAIGPDEFKGKWANLYPVLDRTARPVVECVRIPIGLRVRCRNRGAFIVEVRAPLDVRKTRLRARGLHPKTIKRWTTRQDWGLGYEDTHLRPDKIVELSGGEPLPEVIERIARVLPEAYTRGITT